MITVLFSLQDTITGENNTHQKPPVLQACLIATGHYSPGYTHQSTVHFENPSTLHVQRAGFSHPEDEVYDPVNGSVYLQTSTETYTFSEKDGICALQTKVENYVNFGGYTQVITAIQKSNGLEHNNLDVLQKQFSSCGLPQHYGQGSATYNGTLLAIVEAAGPMRIYTVKKTATKRKTPTQP